MKGYLGIIPLLGLWTSCSMLSDGEDEIASLSEGVNVYDESIIPEASESGENLLVNGSFETEEGWLLCEGGAYYLDDPFAFEGSRVMHFSDQGQVCEEEVFGFGTVAQIAQEINSTGDEPQLVVSFRMKIEGSLPDNISFSIYLSNSPALNYTASYFVGATPQQTGGGWLSFRKVVKSEDWDFYIDNTPMYLLFRIRELDGAEVFIDEVKVLQEVENTQASPMPDDLRNYSGGDRLVFINWSNETMAVMAPNGSQMVNLGHVSTNVALTPSWVNDNEIAVSYKHFYPEIPQDPATIPGAGTDLLKFNLGGGEGDQLYFTMGNPGKYYFSGSFDNVDALDVEIWNADWDSPRDRVAMGICGRNRSPAFVSDDVCLIYIADAQSFEILSDDTPGANPKWSPDGQLAYYWSDGMYVAQVNGGQVQSELVYPARFNLLNITDWSPDNKQLVFGQQDGGTTLLDGEIYYYYTLKTIDLRSREVLTLLEVDHGKLLTDLNWSPDGNYIFYTLLLPGGSSQIWWLDVLNRTTGPITNTISAGYANFSH